MCSGTEFTSTGHTVLDIDWKAYTKQNDKEKSDEMSPSAVSEGQAFTVTASKGVLAVWNFKRMKNIDIHRDYVARL